VGSNVFFWAKFFHTSKKKREGGGSLQIHTRDFCEKNSPKSSYLEAKKYKFAIFVGIRCLLLLMPWDLHMLRVMTTLPLGSLWVSKGHS